MQRKKSQIYIIWKIKCISLDEHDLVKVNYTIIFLIFVQWYNWLQYFALKIFKGWLKSLIRGQSICNISWRVKNKIFMWKKLKLFSLPLKPKTVYFHMCLFIKYNDVTIQFINYYIRLWSYYKWYYGIIDYRVYRQREQSKS